MAYVTLKYDYYKNPVTKTTVTSTMRSKDGNNSYKVILTFLAIPQDNSFHRYCNTYQTTQTNLTNNDYGYGMPKSIVTCLLQVQDSSGNYIQYKDPSGQIKVYLGSNLYSFSLSNLYYYSGYTSYNQNITGYNARLSLDTHGHYPLDGTRSSDSSYAEFITSDQTKISGKTSTVSVSYTTLKLASVPTVDRKHIYVSRFNGSGASSGSIVISTNRNNSSLTHDLYITIGASELYRGNGSPSSNDVDNMLLASNVGASYSWSISSIRNLMTKFSSWNYHKLVYIKCNTKYNGEIVGTTYTHIDVTTEYSTSTTGIPVLSDLSLTNSTMFNNQLYFLNGLSSSCNMRLSGYTASNGGAQLRTVRIRAYENKIYNNVSENSVNVNSGAAWSNFYIYRNSFEVESDSVSTGQGWEYSSVIRLSILLLDSAGSTQWSDTLYVNGTDYSNPRLTGFNIYRVDSNDIPDSEGQYMHISFGGSVSSFESIMNECGDPYNFGPQFNYNHITATLRYKKQTDTSWSSTTLAAQRYDTSVNYDKMLTGYSFDPDSIYEFQLTVSDRYNSVTSSITLRPPIILMDYNASGTALAFGKKSDAKAGDTYIETIMPIIFEDTLNRVSSLNSGVTGAITQLGTNSSNYYNVFVGRTSTGTRRYGITIYDNDTLADDYMRFNVGSSYLDVKYTSMRYYNASNGYYCEVNPVSTYCNFNTSSSYFYFNKNIYMNGNLLATQSWVNTQLSDYLLTSTFNTFKNAHIQGNPKDYTGTGTAINSSYVKIPLAYKADGSTTSHKLLICWGENYFSSWYKSGTTKTVNFPASFYWYPVIMVCPRGTHSFNYPHLSAYSNGGDSFTAVMGDSATRWCENLNIDGNDWGRISSYRDTEKFLSNSFSFNWLAIGFASS